MATGRDVHKSSTAKSRHAQNEHKVTPKWHRSTRTTHVAGANALHKVTRNKDSYISALGRMGVLDGYEIPKKALSKGSYGVVKVSVQLYEEEAKLLMSEGKKSLTRNWTRIIYIMTFLLALPTVYLLLSWYGKINDQTGGLQDRYISLWIQNVLSSIRISFNYCRRIWWREVREDDIYAPSVGWVTALPILMFIPKSVFRWTYLLHEYAHDYYYPHTKISLDYKIATTIQEYFFPRGSRFFLFLYISICCIVLLWALIKRWLEWRCWDFIFVCDALAFDLMDKHPNLSKTQLTTDGVSSHPVVTTILQSINNKLAIKEADTSVKYNSVLRFLIAMRCDNRLEIISKRTSLTVDDTPEEQLQKEINSMDDHHERIEKNNLHPGEREVVGVRTNTAALKRWRKSVEVVKRKAEEFIADIERGIKRLTAWDDYQPDKIGGVQVGPRLCEVTESLDQNLPNENGSISRHLSPLVSKVTGEELPDPTEEAEALLEKAADIIGSVMEEKMDKHGPNLMEYSFPLRWGALTIATMFEYVASLTEYRMPRFSAFVKKLELALPLNKLPRMVVSQGVEGTAAEAEFWCVIENLLKKCFPHLITKGKTEDEIAQQIADMCRRSKSLKRILASLDMSSMDASWTEKDRKRIYKLVKRILKRVEKDLQTQLDNFEDPILYASKKKAKIRINLHYVRIALDACDSILFSGERKTSTGNRLLMLLIVAAEFLRIYGDEEGEKMIKDMMYYPEDQIKFYKDDKDPNRALESESDFRFYNYNEGWSTRKIGGKKYKIPKEPRDVWWSCFDGPETDESSSSEDQNCNVGDGDDDLLSLREGMYSSEKEMMLAWEKYYKLVEVCSPWDETGDAEVLSKFIITTGKGGDTRTWCIPKVQRNFGRLLLIKLQIPSGLFQSNGIYGYELTKNDWIELATQLWNRSYALRHTMILRQLCSAMFWLCITHIGTGWEKCGSIYDSDGQRQGKVDGDKKLSEMAEEIACNVECIGWNERKAAAFALLKALRFKTIGSMRPTDIERMRQAIIKADEDWKQIALTDDMCHNPLLFIHSFPIDAELARDLGYTEDLIIESEHTYPVKGQAEPPEMSAPCATHKAKDSRCGSPKFAAFVMIGDKDSREGKDGRKILVGEEDEASSRKYFVSLPGGKTDPKDFEEAVDKDLPFWVCTAIRELREETGYHVSARDLNLVSVFDMCGCVNFILYTTRDKLSSAVSKKGTDIHLTKLDWRSPSEILGPQGWHPERVSENIWRILHTTKRGRATEGTYQPYDELTKFKITAGSKLITFLHYEGTACVHKHSYQIQGGDSASHITRGFDVLTRVSNRTSKGTGCELQNAGGRSKSPHSRVGGDGATSVSADDVGTNGRSECPPQRLSESGQTNSASHENHGHGTGGNGTPPESCRGVDYGPDMQDQDVQSTGQTSGSEREGALTTERQTGLVNPFSPDLEGVQTLGLSADGKSNPGPTGAGLSSTAVVVGVPRPPPSLTKTAEASNKHKRPADHKSKGRGKVVSRTGPTKAGNPNLGSSPAPSASGKPGLSQGPASIGESRWAKKKPVPSGA